MEAERTIAESNNNGGVGGEVDNGKDIVQGKRIRRAVYVCEGDMDKFGVTMHEEWIEDWK